MKWIEEARAGNITPPVKRLIASCRMRATIRHDWQPCFPLIFPQVTSRRRFLQGAGLATTARPARPARPGGVRAARRGRRSPYDQPAAAVLSRLAHGDAPAQRRSRARRFRRTRRAHLSFRPRGDDGLARPRGATWHWPQNDSRQPERRSRRGHPRDCARHLARHHLYLARLRASSCSTRRRSKASRARGRRNDCAPGS